MSSFLVFSPDPIHFNSSLSDKLFEGLTRALAYCIPLISLFYTYKESLGPVLSTLDSLMGNIMFLNMHSGGIQYDAYFFTPALLALEENELEENGFLKFFARDFTLEKHAKDFEFSDSETKVEFAKRFFCHIAAVENVPDKIRALATKFAKGFTLRSPGDEVNKFLKPCPLYPFVRAISMLKIMEKEVHGVNMEKLEIVIEFLLNDFDPKVYGIEDEANEHDIAIILRRGSGTPVILPDGITARQRSKELLERLASHEAVPDSVKQAIADILPCF